MQTYIPIIWIWYYLEDFGHRRWIHSQRCTLVLWPAAQMLTDYNNTCLVIIDNVTLICNPNNNQQWFRSKKSRFSFQTHQDWRFRISRPDDPHVFHHIRQWPTLVGIIIFLLTTQSINITIRSSTIFIFIIPVPSSSS